MDDNYKPKRFKVRNFVKQGYRARNVGIGFSREDYNGVRDFCMVVGVWWVDITIIFWRKNLI